jgi:chitin synthase
LDKPLESVFGFISVLPGAFSAYRYAALQNRGDGRGPLEKYFIGEQNHGTKPLTLMEANMFLAEDRILCFELITKRHEAWVLHYVHKVPPSSASDEKAKAETDCPDNVPEYISQRRRWLNGSFFAGLHSIMNFWQIMRSGHSTSRIIALLVQLSYNIVNLVFNWFAIGNFYLSFQFLAKGLVQNVKSDPFFGAGVYVFATLRILYLFSVITTVVASLGNRPQGSKWMYKCSFLLFSLIMSVMLYMSGFTIHLAVSQVITDPRRLLSSPAFRDLCLSIVTTFGVYAVSSVIYGDPWHMVTSFLQYLLLLPSFLNILMVYAFCNLHGID